MGELPREHADGCLPERGRSSVGGNGVAFSPDGKLAVAFETPFSFDNGPSELVSYDLSGPGIPQPARHAITISSAWESRTAFSPDSSRLALFSDETLTVYDLPSWKLVAVATAGFPSVLQGVTAAPVPRQGSRAHLQGQPDGPEASSGGTSILEFDLARKTLQQTGHVPAQALYASVGFHGRADARRALAERNFPARPVRRSNGRRDQGDDRVGDPASHGSFLGDGRILVARRGDAQSFLRVYSSEGELQRTCTLSGSRIVVAGPEVRGGKVVLEIWERRTKQLDAKEVRLFDPATGDLQVLPGLRPSHYWWQGAEAEQRPSGGVTSWFFPDDKGKLVRYDFETGKATPVKF